MRTDVRDRAAGAALAVLGCCTSCGPSSPVSAAAPQAYHAAAFVPVPDGADTLELLAGGGPAFAAILPLLDGARTSIHLEMYELQRPDALAALVRAHERGVAVTVIADPTGAGTAVSEAELRGAGLDVVDYPVRARMIDHVKLLVVDAAAAVVGGINWSVASARHHDFDVLVHGPAVANLDRVFASDLVSCGRGGDVPAPVPDTAVAVLPTLPADTVRPVIVRLIEQAAHSVDVELYVLTDQSIVGALVAAAARGVSVRVLLDPSQRPSDASEAALQAAGVPVRRFRTHGELLHAKAMVVDGAAVVLGSANWSTSGFEYNHEVDVAVWDAPALAAEMDEVMAEDWSDSA